MEKATLRLTQLTCPDCAQKIGQILMKQKGVAKADVFFTTSKVKVDYDPERINLDEIEKVIGKTRYRVIERS